VEALLAFGAALLALRLAGDLAARFRARRAPQLAAWAASLLSYALASATLAWGAAAGWDDRSFRIYYLAGGLLTAPLLGLGSLLLRGQRWAVPLAFAYGGLAVGLAIAVPLKAPVTGTSIPEAQAHLDLLPARVVALLGNSLGTLAVVAVALLTLRRRPLGNALILAGVAVAAAGSALAGLGEAETAAFVAVAVVLLYAGFVRSSPAPAPAVATPRSR
jgi:dipeptide/tripeptide permease